MRPLQINKIFWTVTVLMLWTSNCISTQKITTLQRQSSVLTKTIFFYKTARGFIHQKWKKCLSGNSLLLKTHVQEQILKRCYSGNRGQTEWKVESPGDEMCVERWTRASITSLWMDTLTWRTFLLSYLTDEKYTSSQKPWHPLPCLEIYIFISKDTKSGMKRKKAAGWWQCTGVLCDQKEWLIKKKFLTFEWVLRGKQYKFQIRATGLVPQDPSVPLFVRSGVKLPLSKLRIRRQHKSGAWNRTPAHSVHHQTPTCSLSTALFFNLGYKGEDHHLRLVILHLHDANLQPFQVPFLGSVVLMMKGCLWRKFAVFKWHFLEIRRPPCTT